MPVWEHPDRVDIVGPGFDYHSHTEVSRQNCLAFQLPERCTQNLGNLNVPLHIDNDDRVHEASWYVDPVPSLSMNLENR